jgi:hypothetical protein
MRSNRNGELMGNVRVTPVLFIISRLMVNCFTTWRLPLGILISQNPPLESIFSVDEVDKKTVWVVLLCRMVCELTG